MKRPINDIAFTPAVKAAQERLDSRQAYAHMEKRGEQGPWNDTCHPRALGVHRRARFSLSGHR